MTFSSSARDAPLSSPEPGTPGHILFFRHRTGAAHRAAGDHGVGILGLQNGLLVVVVNGALDTGQQAGAHLDAAGTQCEGGSGLTAVRDAAGSHHGDADGVDDLGTRAMVVISPTWPPDSGALGDDGVHAQYGSAAWPGRLPPPPAGP